jgi:endonuclease III
MADLGDRRLVKRGDAGKPAPKRRGSAPDPEQEHRGPRVAVPRREGLEDRRARAVRISEHLAEAYPDADCELVWRNPFELLVATILSAQCTDKMVNQVTPALFEQFPDARAMARASQRRVERLIRRTGFYMQKTKAVRSAAASLVERFGAEVPRDMESLTSLQGVGRKTASVVLGTAFGEPAVFVDTHVRRLSNRMALTRHGDPAKIETDIRSLIPSKDWTPFCHRMIHHGRRICFARAPRCDVCPVTHLCPKVGVGRAKKP